MSYNLNKSEIVIACGTCVIIKSNLDILLKHGLDVQGRLVIPLSSVKLNIVTSHVFVQSILKLDSSDIVITNEVSHSFKLIGDADVEFVPHP